MITTPIRHPLDLYTTPPQAVTELLRLEKFSKKIWEPAAGTGVITEILENAGHEVRSSDIDVMFEGCEQKDFLLPDDEQWDGDIITNPPYKKTIKFVEMAFERLQKGHKLALFLPISFLEGIKHTKLLSQFRPTRIYISRRRLNCPRVGEDKTTGGIVCYTWVVWEVNWHGPTTLEWFN